MTYKNLYLKKIFTQYQSNHKMILNSQNGGKRLVKVQELRDRTLEKHKNKGKKENNMYIGNNHRHYNKVINKILFKNNKIVGSKAKIKRIQQKLTKLMNNVNKINKIIKTRMINRKI